jgi:hypothetical protein
MSALYRALFFYGEIMHGIDLIKKDINNLDKVIDVYKSYLDDVEQIIETKGKTLSVANAEHAGWVYYYLVKANEVKTMYNYMEIIHDEVHGRLWQKYTEKMDRALSPKDKECYIKHDPTYLNVLEQIRKLEELVGLYKSVTTAFESRGYVLKNITSAVLADKGNFLIN